jgi:serine/threonine-protein kinase RsbW
MSAANSPRTYLLAVPSIPDRITEVDDFLESTLREAGVVEETIADVAIAVTEIVNNAIDHGNAGDPEKMVNLSVVLTAGELKIEVADEGGGFDPGAVANPLAQENLLREVGRGIFIVRHLMDTVEIEARPGRGTTVRITKKLDPPLSS